MVSFVRILMVPLELALPMVGDEVDAGRQLQGFVLATADFVGGTLGPGRPHNSVDRAVDDRVRWLRWYPPR